MTNAKAVAAGRRASDKSADGHKYVLVDEYQDTNYVQKRLLLRLVQSTRNLYVVGEEDQSLYHFRDATVRNILEFPQRMPGCAVVELTTNYRSHEEIRLVPAPDCRMKYLPREIAFGKLQALSRGTEIVRRKLT